MDASQVKETLEDLATLQSQLDQAAGKSEAALQRLRDQFKLPSAKAAEKEAAKLEAKLKVLESELQGMLEEWQEKFEGLT